MANASEFFERAIPAPGNEPVTASGYAPDEVENAPDLLLDVSIPETDRDANPVDLSEHRSMFAGAFAQDGWDAIAFYAPYHRHGPENWGIYFLTDRFLGAVDAVREQMASAGADRSQAWVFGALAKAVHAHELTHFSVEIAAAHAETITNSDRLYEIYLRKGREERRGEPALTEEAIATAREVRRARRIDRTLAGVIGAMSEGLPGYGDFADHLTDEESGRRLLLENLVGPVSATELLAEHISRPYFASVRVRWLPPRLDSAGLDDLLPRIVALPLRQVLRDARRRPGIVVNEHSGGDHPTQIERGKQFVPVSLNWDRVPHHVVKEIAALFGLKPGEYCAQVLNKRHRP